MMMRTKGWGDQAFVPAAFVPGVDPESEAEQAKSRKRLERFGMLDQLQAIEQKKEDEAKVPYAVVSSLFSFLLDRLLAPRLEGSFYTTHFDPSHPSPIRSSRMRTPRPHASVIRPRPLLLLLPRYPPVVACHIARVVISSSD